MDHPARLSLLAALALALPSCLAPAADETLGEAQAAVAAGGACTGTGPRWIGTDGLATTCANPAADCPCPPAAGWNAARAFAFTPGGAVPLPPLLAPYCLYTWAGAGDVSAADAADLKAAVAPQIVDLAEDCVIVAPHASPVEGEVRAWMRGQFRAAARGAGPLPRGGVPPESVEIAVLDSSPTDATGQIPLGQLEHGHVVGWIGRDLTCDDGLFPPPATCFGHVTTRLALPYLDDHTVDRVHGGSFGTRVELGQQMVAAVEAWKLHAALHPRLAIPLALGWDPAFGSPTDAASRAVHAAIVHAACHGAFVAAAAGNATGGPSPGVGPLLPAAWGSEPAPGEIACTALEGAPAQLLVPGSPYPVLPGPGAPPSPLLLAIGGVDHTGAPIALTRPGSVARLAALALQGEAGAPGPDLPAPLTGTSIAAAVVGGAAASVWAYAPSLTAPEVMALLAQTAVPTPKFSPAQRADPAGLVGVVSIPAARAFPCAGPAGASNPRCPPGGAPPPAGFAAKNPAWPLPVQADVTAYFGASPIAVPVLTAQSPFDLAPSVAVPAWVHPQPLQPGCSVCKFGASNGSLDVAISSRYASSIGDVTLILTSAKATTKLRIAASMSPGDALRASLGVAYSATQTAQLAWTVAATGASASEQISVY